VAAPGAARLSLLQPVMSALGEAPPAHIEVHGSGPPVLVLHGWGASSQLFAPLVPLLGSRHRLLIPDLPGFGGTPAPPVAWASAEYAAWVVALLDRLGVASCDVIGHSNGGRVALSLAVRFPERVRHLVLTGAAGIRPRHGLRHHWRLRTYKMLRVASRTHALPRAARAWAQRRAERRGSADYRAASGVMRQTLVRLVNEDVRPLLSRVQSPALLIWGERDAETPLADGRLMERLIRDSGLVVFEGAGHYAYLEQPERFARIVGVFLDSEQGAAR
jgi:pimeloyl-ACP methyl ester carboxylesterase